MIIYYDSKTGNVARFVNKVCDITGWRSILLSNRIEDVQEYGHLVTYTTQQGKVPLLTMQFVEEWYPCIGSISSSGNRNWGKNFALAADIISSKYNIPILAKFELSGLDKDVKEFIEKVTDYENK